MPGCVVDFGHGKKEKAAGKATLCLKIFNYVLIASEPARKPMRQYVFPFRQTRKSHFPETLALVHNFQTLLLCRSPFFAFAFALSLCYGCIIVYYRVYVNSLFSCILIIFIFHNIARLAI